MVCGAVGGEPAAAAGAPEKGYPARGCAPRPAARAACSRRLVVDGRVVGEAALPGRAHFPPVRPGRPRTLLVHENAPPLRPRDRPGSKAGGAMRVRALLARSPHSGAAKYCRCMCRMQRKSAFRRGRSGSASARQPTSRSRSTARRRSCRRERCRSSCRRTRRRPLTQLAERDQAGRRASSVSCGSGASTGFCAARRFELSIERASRTRGSARPRRDMIVKRIISASSSAARYRDLSPVRRIPTPPIGWTWALNGDQRTR